MSKSANKPQMTSRQEQIAVSEHWTKRCRELLQDRNNLSEDDLGYLVEQTAKLKDERLKACIAELIGWGTDDKAELETFCAIALELMKDASPSRLRECVRKVELRYLMKDMP